MAGLYQPSLIDRLDAPPCRFGNPIRAGAHHCDACEAEVNAAIEWMRLARLRGEFDAEGYTPNERRAQRRRAR
jgi:hypothetical protein